MTIRFSIEIDPASGTGRLRAAVLAGLLVLGGAGIAYAALPSPTFTMGEPLRADKMNKALPPVGTVIAYAGDVADGSIPPGWVLCDGRSLPRIGTYASLFQVLGTAHGSADATSFNVPDLRGQFLRGVDNPTGTSAANVDKNVAGRTRGAGASLSTAVGTLESFEVQSHAHSVSDPGHGHPTSHWFTVGPGSTPWGPSPAGAGRSGIPGATPYWGDKNGADWFTIGGHTTGVSVNSAGGAETRPTNVALNFLIRAE